MKVKKTWFSYLSLFLFLCGGLYVFICATNGLGDGREYPYFVKGMAIGIIAVAYLLVAVVSVLCARLQLMERVQKYQWQLKVAEWAIAILILLLSFLLRVLFVRSYPMEPQSDYKTYYEIAGLLNKGTLLEDGIGYCDYVSMFPHVLGYSYVLSIVMKYFGSSVWVGQCFNIILAVLTCFIVWRIAVLLAGRVSGLIGLILTAFWPSQIIYNNFLASEYLFSFLMCLCIWLFLVLVKKYDVNHPKQQQGVFLHVVLGIFLAIDNAVRPMALLLLISILLCLAPSRMPLAIKPRNDLSISERILEKGWLRGFIILCSFMVSSAFLTKCVSYTVDRELAGGSASFGYNLLVGLNQSSYGGWNEEDSHYLYSAIEETGSAVDAQIACRDLAFQRLKVDKVSLLNLFLHKFDVLWSNDDYASSFNIIFMQEQGNLTSEREDFFYGIRDIDNVWYLISIAFSMIAVLYMMKRSSNWSYLLVILFLGTVAMHLLVENQNRYHFHALYLFAILGSVGLHYLYYDYKQRLVIQDATKEMRERLKLEEQEAMERILEAQAYAKEQLSVKMEGSFDMEKALKEGHVEVSVTQSYEETPLHVAEVAATKEAVQELKKEPEKELEKESEKELEKESEKEAEQEKVASDKQVGTAEGERTEDE